MCPTEKSSCFHLSSRCAVHSDRTQRAAPCNFDEGSCSCPPIPVEPQTVGKSGCLESPAEKTLVKMTCKLKSPSCLI